MSKIFKETQVIIDEAYNVAVMPFFIKNPVSTEVESETVKNEEKNIDINEQYASFLSDMENMKDEILEKAVKDSEQIKQSAYQEGKLEGYNDGKAEAELNYKKRLDEINEIKDEIIKEKEHMCETLEQEVINLVINICERVLFEDAVKLEDVISERVKQALKGLNSIKDISIRVNYEDIDYLSALKEKLKGEDLNIIPDYKLHKGDFIIETPNGLIDYSMAQAMKNIKDTLIEVLKNDRA